MEVLRRTVEEVTHDEVRFKVIRSSVGGITEDDVLLASASEAFIIGFMANNVLPARLGDVARAFVLARRRRIPAAGTFASVMLERIFDGIVVVGFLNAVLWLAPPSGTWIRPLAYLGALIFVGALTVCLLIARFEAPYALIGFCAQSSSSTTPS